MECITPVHAGSGRGSSVVDLPIQRDAFGYPTIFASSLKGAIRGSNNDEIYGSEDFAGAFAPLDAKLLFIPVRSLFGVYCLATCPFLLKSLKQYLGMHTHDENNIIEKLDSLLKNANGVDNSKIIVSPDSRSKLSVQLSGKNVAILADEFKLEIGENDEIPSFGSALGIDDGWRIAIVSDDLMRNSLVNRSLMTVARIKLENGRAAQNALWTEENLPEKTVLHTVFFYSKSRSNMPKSSDEVKKSIEDKVGGKYVIFGGHETVGRGIIKIKVV
jgi:CRISPR-associated protein Cmr4